MLKRVREDVRAILERDPAARSTLEVLCCYPGMHALWAHRAIHRLWQRDSPFLARLAAHVVRGLTGVEIHPGATVGRRVTIDHGMGIVVGETAQIGDDVHLYHGVTLGGEGTDPVARHPTLEDGVRVGANATIVGPIMVGEGATVGAGSVVVDDVPAGVTVAGVPARPV